MFIDDSYVGIKEDESLHVWACQLMHRAIPSATFSARMQIVDVKGRAAARKQFGAALRDRNRIVVAAVRYNMDFYHLGTVAHQRLQRQFAQTLADQFPLVLRKDTDRDSHVGLHPSVAATIEMDNDCML